MSTFRLSPAAALFAASLLLMNSASPLAAQDQLTAPVPALGADARSLDEWQSRRPGIVELFREHVYGRSPVGRPDSLRFEPGELAPAFDGQARRRQVRISYRGADDAENGINLACYYPPEGEPIKGVFILIVNRSPRIVTEAETKPSEFWPVADIVARGYATAAFHYSDVAPDKKEDDLQNGVFALYGPHPRADDAWGAIGAWAWGASRVVDYVETDPLLKGVPVAVAGHSRGGKTALWCGAQDERVVLTISNNSGTTGAAVARVSRGETITRINTVFPHWFALNYRRYNDRPEALPVDQHLLVAALAPRLAYVSSAVEDAHADPAAEFRACVEASPVYELHGHAGVKPATFPAVGEARHEGRIGYHLRPGGHDLLREDWRRFMDFADRHLPAAN